MEWRLNLFKRTNKLVSFSSLSEEIEKRINFFFQLLTWFLSLSTATLISISTYIFNSNRAHSTFFCATYILSIHSYRLILEYIKLCCCWNMIYLIETLAFFAFQSKQNLSHGRRKDKHATKSRCAQHEFDDETPVNCFHQILTVHVLHNDHLM